MSIDRWMEKENGEIYRSPNLAIWGNIDRSRGYYAKWNKSDRERQISYDFTYMWNLKQQNKWINEKQDHTYQYWEQTDGCQRGVGWGNRQTGWRGVGDKGFQWWEDYRFVCVCFLKISFIYLWEREQQGEHQAEGEAGFCWAGSPTQVLIPGPRDRDLSRRWCSADGAP